MPAKLKPQEPKVGDTCQRGTIIKVAALPTGTPIYHVQGKRKVYRLMADELDSIERLEPYERAENFKAEPLMVWCERHGIPFDGDEWRERWYKRIDYKPVHTHNVGTLSIEYRHKASGLSISLDAVRNLINQSLLKHRAMTTSQRVNFLLTLYPEAKPV